MVACTASVLAVSCAAALLACRRSEAPRGFQGVVELDERVLSFEVPGRVTSVQAERGDHVTPHDIVATLDDTQARGTTEMRDAEAIAAEERAKLVGAGRRVEDIREQEARLREAEARERLAVKRETDDRSLAARGAIPGAQLDDSETRARAAVAERQAAQQQLRELRTGSRKEEVAGAKAEASAAAAAARVEADRMSRYQLRPLHPGEVLDVHVEAGEVVAAGTPVLTVGDTTHPYVDVFVPQQALGGVRVGAPAIVRVDSLPQALHGVVEHVARFTEFTPRYLFSERERSNLVVRTRVRVDDPQRVLHAGVPAHVTIARGLTAMP
ncbi:MAG: secretion protein HlyD family protein [Myxococcales bacterium]|nr:secretion protein HlyD family protein [Myxococcales bacterium]